MEIQLNEYEKKYGYKKIIEPIAKEHLEEIEEILKIVIEKMPMNREYQGNYFFKDLAPYVRVLIRNGGHVNLSSNVTLGYLITKQDNMKWINCNCGAVGKYKRRF